MLNRYITFIIIIIILIIISRLLYAINASIKASNKKIMPISPNYEYEANKENLKNCEDSFTDRYIYNDYPYLEFEKVRKGRKFADIIRY